MKKNSLFLAALFCAFTDFGQESTSKQSQNKDIIASFNNLEQKQLYDTAVYYYRKNISDTALVCFNLIINSPVSYDSKQQLRVVTSLNMSGLIYINMCDYRNAYKCLIDALQLCEKYNIASEKPRLYNNIGNIYYWFKKYDIAKYYYNKALDLCEDTTSIDIVLNNLGGIEYEKENIDSAFYFLNRSLQISKLKKNSNLAATYHTLASVYKLKKEYDSAYYYYQLSITESRKRSEKAAVEAYSLSDLSKMFVKIKNIDSTLHYIDLSNKIAEEKNISTIIADNCLTLSEIEESKGNTKKALAYYKQYANLKDSIFNNNVFGDINQLQRLYEVSKTNQHIEQLLIEQHIKDRTIKYQRIIFYITLMFFIIVSIVLFVIYLQKRKLNKSNKFLVDKNEEIRKLLEKEYENKSVSLHESDYNEYTAEILPDNHSEEFIDIIEEDTEKSNDVLTCNNAELDSVSTYADSENKSKKFVLSEKFKKELLDRILTVMENSAEVYNNDFSVDILTKLVNSNYVYVSYVINNVIKKNFCSFLDIYRVREAQRLFSEPNVKNYTIETVAKQVGYKSRNTFHNAFKELTGVTPSFYYKSIQKSEE